MNHLATIPLLLAAVSGCEAAEASATNVAAEQPAEASSDSSAATVTAKIRGLRNTEGGIVAYLHSEDSFPRKFNKAAKKRHRKSFKSTSTTLRFDDVAPGTYALVVIHDENGNGDLDKNLVGFPKEGIGASNVEKGRPSWAQAKFEVSEDRSVKVTMQYF